MPYELHKRIKDVASFNNFAFSPSVPLCILHWLSVIQFWHASNCPEQYTTSKPTWVFTSLLHRSTPYRVFSIPVIIPLLQDQPHRAHFEFSLDRCKAVLRPSYTFSSMTHSSGLLAPSTASMGQSFISLLRAELKMPHINCCCKHRFAQRWLGKPFDFQQLPHEDFYSLPTIQPNTLCLFSFASLPTGHGNASLHPNWLTKLCVVWKMTLLRPCGMTRSQAGLHLPCGFCVFITAWTKGQYNIFNKETVK